MLRQPNRFPAFALVFAALVVPCFAQAAAAEKQTDKKVNGRVDIVRGLRVLRVWGTPQERGYAQGKLLGKEIADLLRAEFDHRFSRNPPLLGAVRLALPRLITYPDDVAAELAALWQGLVDSGAKLALPDHERDLDLKDLQLVNALDVFGTMGCSGFTIWGDMVEGGGVLTTRNFDWPVSGPHLVDATVLAVHEPKDGHAFAAVTWPGYLGVVTGVSKDGVAAFLHVGSGENGEPEPDSMPTAIAARVVLQGASPDAVAALAKTTLENTSPPASYISRFVLPKAPEKGSPALVFETTVKGVKLGEHPSPCITTNHFMADKGGKDSSGRYGLIDRCMHTCLASGDHKVSVAEAWEALQDVQRSGKVFATLHSIVFRAEPWLLELRVGEVDADGEVVAAPRAQRRYSLTRDDVFGDRESGDR